MKTNWFSLAAFAVVVVAIVAAHMAHIDQLTTLLLSAALPLVPALLPAIAAKGDGSKSADAKGNDQ